MFRTTSGWDGERLLPGAETAGTAVAFNRFGKGQSLYIGAPIFWAMEWRAEWIQVVDSVAHQETCAGVLSPNCAQLLTQSLFTAAFSMTWRRA